jgi:flagellar FliJ protein
MGKYQFQLESVLSYRESLVDAREVDLATAVKAQSQAEDVLGLLQREQAMAMVDVREQRLAAHLDVLTLCVAESYLARLESQIAHQAAVVQELAQQTETCRTALNEALKEKKKVERLKEKEAQAYAQEEARVEQVQADDLNTVRYNRRKVV